MIRLRNKYTGTIYSGSIATQDSETWMVFVYYCGGECGWVSEDLRRFEPINEEEWMPFHPSQEKGN